MGINSIAAEFALTACSDKIDLEQSAYAQSNFDSNKLQKVFFNTCGEVGIMSILRHFIS